MEKTILTVENLSHRYSVQWAVRDINFDIMDKGIVGLLGVNGAGKSTIMNIICGVLNQTNGNVFINGINIRKEPIEAKKHIGFLPQQPPLYPDLTVYEYLKHSAFYRLLNKKDVKKYVDIAMDKCSITHFRNRLIKNLSGGYQQRVGIAQSIVHNPNIIVLDEPTNGLDPNQIVEIRNLIREISKDNTVLLSTHILSEVQVLCDSIIMIDSGKLVFSGKMEQFDNYIEPESFIVEYEEEVSIETLNNISENSGIEQIGKKSFRIFFNNNIDITEKYIEDSISNKRNLLKLQIERFPIEQIFAQLSQK